jgi:hypothetical protein
VLLGLVAVADHHIMAEPLAPDKQMAAMVLLTPQLLVLQVQTQEVVAAALVV